MKRSVLIPLALILFAAVFLTPFFTAFIREVVVIPLLYILWIGRFLLRAVPQGVIWTVFVLGLALIMLISLSGKQRPPRKQLRLAPADEERIESWLKLLRQAQRDDYFKWRLAQNLQRLAIDIFAHRNDQSHRDARQQLKQGDLNLPPELHAYFQASLKPLGYLNTPRRFFSSKQTAPTALDLDPARVADFLENLNNDTIIILNNPKETP